MVDRLKQACSFFDICDDEGISNRDKVQLHQKILRRVDSADKSQSVERVEKRESQAFFDAQGNEFELPSGVVVKDGKLIGFGIHIFNEDVYPLQSFEIYLRACELCGSLDLSGCSDLVFVDVYHNHISEVLSQGLTSLRIFGVQDNRLESLDASQMPAVQGIDAGLNRLSALDVSSNPELVELYINDNRVSQMDLSANVKLKYFYCQNNRLSEIDTRNNPLLRHLNATENPLKDIWSLAPQREGLLPLELHACEGGSVGLKFNPVYNAQWKETGEWQQSYYAYPDEGWSFEAWVDADGKVFSREAVCFDEYGSSRVLAAMFSRA